MTCCCDDSRASPTWFLKLNLSFKSFGKINDKQLNEAAAQCNTSKDVEITFRPYTHNFDTTWCPNFLWCWRNWLRLNSISTHNVDETRRDICWIYTTAVRDTTSFNRRWWTVKVFVFWPIQKTSSRQSTAIELLLNKVDEVLKVRVVSIQCDYLKI